MYLPQDIFELIVSYCRPYYWYCKPCAFPFSWSRHCVCKYLSLSSKENTRRIAECNRVNYLLAYGK